LKVGIWEAEEDKGFDGSLPMLVVKRKDGKEYRFYQSGLVSEKDENKGVD